MTRVSVGALRQVALAVGFAALVMAAPASARTAADGAREDANREIVRAAFEAWANGESVFEALLADDVVWTIHGSDPVSRTYTGRDSFVEDASMPLVSRLTGPVVPEVRQIWADGDTVIVRFDGTATTTSGAPYENRFVWIFQMADERVVRAEAFLDMTAYRAVVDNNRPRD
ncbi:ketosteroid isomerase [Acuticoccus sediminis]|uniref:Ketosteroid isomerase n=1 Tax=Acuticoccus sediminis TaxID=2184697 RepID=A0A8B2NUG0_9HYPH|nr:nuclear transport factor 2 family protein [Acuticoccus sediminis]RAI02139.1 ketosteroid isomerase [Acuticoccus sediminis]